jgi:hypothetical protein
VFGTQGPWPVANAIYGAKDGIKELPVIGVTTDEAQNRWVATNAALYLLEPGATTFKRFDERDGLHMGSNQAHYCNDRPIPVGQRCTSVESWGTAAPPGIQVIVGGGKGEVFVGYHAIHLDGNDCGNNGNGEDWCDPMRHSGKIDRVRVGGDGTLTVDRFDLVANNHGGKYWHDRDIQRLAFDHFVHPHTLYSGSEHGVTMLLPDKYRLPRDGEWYDLAYEEWMGDHLHARVCFERPCDSTASNQRMGDWKGLAIDANGDLWHAGKWTAGLISFDPVPLDWFGRNAAAFLRAFGDPWDGAGGNPPVFPVANEGHDVNLTAVAVCPDGVVWFSSLGTQDGPDVTIASWVPGRFTYHAPADLGLPERSVRDLVCLPDGRLVLAGFETGLALYDPKTGATSRITSGNGIPSDEIQALEVDRMASPRGGAPGAAVTEHPDPHARTCGRTARPGGAVPSARDSGGRRSLVRSRPWLRREAAPARDAPRCAGRSPRSSAQPAPAPR